MTRRLPWVALLATLAAGLASADTPSREDTTMTLTARGSFDVKVAPVTQEDFPEGNNLGRFSLEKSYHGDLEATARGEMLTAGTPVAGSAAYVAMERVEGSLGGRRGTFLLQHLGTMGGGEQHLSITVVRDSGTGELVGLAGTLEVTITEDGGHFYSFEHTLPASRE